jgi:biotin transport system substrate-specific component
MAKAHGNGAAHLAPTLAGALWPARGDARLGLLRGLVLAFLGTSALTLSAKLQVPFYPVPMTLQSLVVLLIGASYGWRLGTATLVLYLVEGALGLPVFAGTPEKGLGVAYMAGRWRLSPRFRRRRQLVGWLAEARLGPIGHALVRRHGDRPRGDSPRAMPGSPA